MCSQVNRLFGNQLAGRGFDKDNFLLDVEMNPGKCSLGIFLASDYLAKQKKAFPELGEAMDAVVGPHNRLHASAARIQQNGP